MMVLFFTGLAFTMLSFFYEIVACKRDNHIDDCYDFITMILLPTMMLMIERLLGSGRELSIIAGGCGASSQHP